MKRGEGKAVTKATTLCPWREMGKRKRERGERGEMGKRAGEKCDEGKP